MLVEVVVATLVLTVGVLALAGTAPAVERMVAAGERMGGAAAAAASRFERLRAAGCGAPSDGRTDDARYTERWVVTAAGPLRTVALIVTYADGRGTRSDAFEAAQWCP